MSGRRGRQSAAKALFAERGWKPFPFQREVWREMANGRSGLLHATTGAGKTLAVALGAWQALADEGKEPPRLRTLWITPMRALAADAARALAEAFDVLSTRGQRWTVGVRSGDTPPAERARQARRPPSVLITTPESLSLMLSRADAPDYLSTVRCVVVDEWHELIGNKRGVQTQLAIARLKRWRPDLLIWGMSATLGNLEEAKRVLLGPADASRGVIVAGILPKELIIDTLLPQDSARFPWAGHLGIKMATQVVEEIEKSKTSLVFTNTRSQAEIWYHNLLSARPDWAGVIAVHHGSLAQDSRDWVERGLKAGKLKAVVCTSSLDLGVDFLPVERVLQVGSPKGVARLLQRAGRSGHSPGRTSRITLVPSHALELVESSAVQQAVRDGRIESRDSPNAPLDVLVQHLVTIGLGGGFLPDDLRSEIGSTAAYQHLSNENWRWCLDFISGGGPSLSVYPEYRRCGPDADGVWRVTNKRIALRHRLNIGTITADASVLVQYGPAPAGRKLGVVEESFVARLKPGDNFWFAGRLLEFTRLRDLVAYVRPAKARRGAVPRWDGGRMPLSTTLADAMVEQLQRAADGRFDTPELRAAERMLRLQARWSHLPTPATLLAETLKSRDGWHLFLYPFAGRNAHVGMASLIAWRAAQVEAGTFSIAVNDYGFELLSADARDWARMLPELIAPRAASELTIETLASLNAAELARRRFRDIAQIAGLVVKSYPGQHKSLRQLQASSSLFYDVFRKFDPENGLLRQAELEVLEEALDIMRLAESFERMNNREIVHVALKRCSPLAFPLMVERMRERLSNETLAARIERMTAQLERAADKC
ncbi:MAG: ligase-associated DNA damage response DEXH box helicase [Methylocystis sp.]